MRHLLEVNNAGEPSPRDTPSQSGIMSPTFHHQPSDFDLGGNTMPCKPLIGRGGGPIDIIDMNDTVGSQTFRMPKSPTTEALGGDAIQTVAEFLN